MNTQLCSVFFVYNKYIQYTRAEVYTVHGDGWIIKNAFLAESESLFGQSKYLRFCKFYQQFGCVYTTAL